MNRDRQKFTESNFLVFLAFCKEVNINGFRAPEQLTYIMGQTK